MTLSEALSDRRPAMPQAARQSHPASGLRLAISSVFGDPLAPSTWSGAPSNLARELGNLGAEVSGICPRPSLHQVLWDVWLNLINLRGQPFKGETALRVPPARTRSAMAVVKTMQRLDVDRVLHTGTFDLPAPVVDGTRHYLYCDHTWNLARRHLPGGKRRSARWADMSEETEREAFASTRHIFTFGRYVRDDLIDHYRVPADRVTAVGSGMGPIEPYVGGKDYTHGPLLFIAKHYFVEKGGPLALKAFRLARRRRPNLRLVIVGNERWHRIVGDEPGVHVMGHVSWEVLEELHRSAAALLQPMLNDPWGQVYLEALVSRTPVIGLERNGLPEITQNGRHGFMAPIPDPVVLAEIIVDAMADPARLARMGESGQRHVLANYSWARVARIICETIEEDSARRTS